MLDSEHDILLRTLPRAPSENDNSGVVRNGPDGPGLAKVRTAPMSPARTYSAESVALCVVLDGRPWSRRRLAAVLGVSEKIVRDWCDGLRPVQVERLKERCPVVWSRWVERMTAERSAA